MKLENCLKQIRDEKIDNLKNVDYLEKILPTFGIDPSLKRIGTLPLNLEPFCDKDIGFAQYPNQFSRYLKELSDKRIESYMEIGVKFGGTFIITVEYLNRFHPIKKAVCVDVRPESENLKKYKKIRDFEYYQMDSRSDKAEKLFDGVLFDLCLIDGDHSYDGCYGDYTKYKKTSKHVAFHDIVMMDGVVKTWEKVKKESKWYLEFTQQYDIDPVIYEGIQYQTCLGLGLAEI